MDRGTGYLVFNADGSFDKRIPPTDFGTVEVWGFIAGVLPSAKFDADLSMSGEWCTCNEDDVDSIAIVGARNRDG